MTIGDVVAMLKPLRPTGITERPALKHSPRNGDCNTCIYRMPSRVSASRQAGHTSNYPFRYAAQRDTLPFTSLNEGIVEAQQLNKAHWGLPHLISPQPAACRISGTCGGVDLRSGGTNGITVWTVKLAGVGRSRGSASASASPLQPDTLKTVNCAAGQGCCDHLTCGALAIKPAPRASTHPTSAMTSTRSVVYLIRPR